MKGEVRYEGYDEYVDNSKKGNKMTSVLEGMKILDLYSGTYIKQGCYIDLEDDNKIYGGDGSICLSDTQPHRFKPLLRFPDKDSEGQALHSGDLLKSFDDLLLLYHDGFTWFFGLIEEGNIVYKRQINKKQENIYTSNTEVRLCHLYDPKALEFLPEDVVSKLKGEMK